MRTEHEIDLSEHLGYGYGFLCVLFISTFSLAGVVAFPLMKKPFYKYINAFFVSVATGALFANSTFELIPAVGRFSVKDHFLNTSTRSRSSHSPSMQTENLPIHRIAIPRRNPKKMDQPFLFTFGSC